MTARTITTTQGGAQSVCRTHDGQPWHENWDATWRPSYACCVGSSKTREIAVDFVRTCIDLGLDWIQFFDQNVGCAPFPCFSAEHGHTDQPGSWMTDEMGRLLAELHAVMDEAEPGRGRGAAHRALGGGPRQRVSPCPPFTSAISAWCRRGTARGACPSCRYTIICTTSSSSSRAALARGRSPTTCPSAPPTTW